MLVQCMMTRFSSPTAWTALWICRIVDIPVETIIGFPVPRTCFSKVMVREGRRRNLIGRRIELFHEIDGPLVPYRDHPADPFLPAVGIDLPVLLQAEFHPVAILKIGDVTPRSLPHLSLLRRRRGYVGSSLLEFHSIRAGVDRGIDDLFGDLQVAVVIDSHLSDDVGRLPIAHGPASKAHLTIHLPVSRSEAS